MPPKRVKKPEKVSAINSNYSDDSDDSDTNQRPKKSAKNSNRNYRPTEPPPEFSDDAVSDNDIYNDDNRAYMKIANEVVMKNVKLPALFDPNVLPGFSALINNTSKISAASRVLEASFKVFGKRVDVVHTEARKLDQDVLTRTVEDEQQKKKPVEVQEDPLNESLNEWGGNDADFFSEEDEATVTQKKEKHKEAKSMNVDMTMANFDFDGDMSIPPSIAMASNSDSSFQFEDNNLRKRLSTIAKDRTVLMGSQKRSTKDVEKRLKRANAAAMEYFRKELLKRGGYRGAKKEASDEKDTANDFSYFHNSFYQYAMNKKREKRHVCIDDVAANSNDYTRIYMHNEWCDEEDEPPPSAEDAQTKMMDNAPDDGDFLYFPDIYRGSIGEDKESEDDNDILDGVLEQFQGTLELATANNHKLEDGWVELLGLEKKDLRPSNKTDITFEQTANNDFDPDKRLVDRLIIEGEDEAMKAEEDRVENLIKRLFSGRIKLPGGPGNSNENSLRRQINSATRVEMYHDEDLFFPFDQSKYVTSESVNSQIAVSRSHFIKHTSIKDAKSFGLPDKLFEVLQNYTLPITPIHEDIITIVETLPNYIFIKGLLNNTVSKFEYGQNCQMLSSFITPFRISRYCEQLVTSVIHQVQSFNLKPEFFDSRASRAQSTRPQSSLYHTNTPLKKSRIDETLCSGETYRYFAAFELEKTQRYPNQIFNNNDDNQIYKIVSKILTAEKGAFAFHSDRINHYYTGQAIFTLLAYIRFYADNRGKDLSKFPIVQELPETVFDESEGSVSNENDSAERDALIENLNIIPIPVTEAAPMEIDHDFDNDFDFHDAHSSPPRDAPVSSQKSFNAVISQDLFASGDDNDNGGAYEDADDFGGNFFDDVRQESTIGTLDDSLAKIVRRSEVPVTPIVSTRPKRNAKKIQFVEDDAHWEKPADAAKKAKKKKPTVREELLQQHDDNLLFAPRETFANVTTSRRRTPSVPSSLAAAMEASPRMSRSQNFSLPEKISDKFAYRLELGQTVPGYNDHDKIFFAVRFNEYMRRAFQPNAVLYRGELSFLPTTSSTRQENDFVFWLQIYRLCSDLTEVRKQESKTRKSIEEGANINNVEMNYDGVSDDEYHDAPDYDFDVLDGGPSSPQRNIQPRQSTQYAGSLMGEYQHYRDEDDDDDEIDDFDFESKRDKNVTLHYSEGKFALKRAIKYILTKARYDRSTLPDEISGLKAPLPQITNEVINTQMLQTSTPTAIKKSGVFEFEYDDDEIIGGDTIQNDDIQIDEEESDWENDSDETRMKDFKVDGFHTLKSLLFYLPEVCHPDTVKVLSVAHVFCTLCHMANENSLHFIQEEVFLDGNESTSDCRILNRDDAEVIEIENNLDEEMDSDDESSD